MSTILVTYDLNQPGQNYEKVHAAIKAAGSDYKQILESTWIVKGMGLTAQGVYDQVKPSMDDSDNAFVVDITGQAHQGWLPKAYWAWLNN